MMIKFSSQFFLFCFIYTCIILNVAIQTTYAATVINLESNENAILSPSAVVRFQQQEMEYKYRVLTEYIRIQKKQSPTTASKSAQHKKVISSNSLYPQQQFQNTTKFLSSATRADNTSSVSAKQAIINTKNIYQQLKNSGQDFLSTNKDNALLQDALITLGNTKKLINETETSLNSLSQKILLSLELDYYLQSNLLILQQNYNSTSQSIYPPKTNSLHYQKNISASEIQDYEYININLLKKLYSISSLYYLSALILFFSILKWLLKMLLTRKYKPKHTNYMYMPNQKKND